MTFTDLAAASFGQKAVVRLAGTRVGRLMFDLVGYGLVSVVALACDYGLLLALVHAGVHYLVASTISFSTGMVLAYALSVKFVFASRRGLSREVEAAGFFAVGVVGLLMTQGLLYAFVTQGGMAVALAKIPTTGIVFLFNFLCRRGMVFVGLKPR